MLYYIACFTKIGIKKYSKYIDFSRKLVTIDVT